MSNYSLYADNAGGLHLIVTGHGRPIRYYQPTVTGAAALLMALEQIMEQISTEEA